MLFEDIHKKLQRTLARKKQEMAAVIGIISDSHEAREKVGGECNFSGWMIAGWAAWCEASKL